MSHFAKVVNGIVTEVIVAEQNFVDALEGTWVQTSYNTHGGVHYTYGEREVESIDSIGIVTYVPKKPVPSGQSGLRKNYAGVGYTYDESRDAFYDQQPYPSWLLNEDSCIWEPPTPYTTDGNAYTWDEETTSWVEV